SRRGARVVGGDEATQRTAGLERGVLTDHLVERARPHPHCERRPVVAVAVREGARGGCVAAEGEEVLVHTLRVGRSPDGARRKRPAPAARRGGGRVRAGEVGRAGQNGGGPGSSQGSGGCCSLVAGGRSGITRWVVVRAGGSGSWFVAGWAGDVAGSAAWVPRR